jgi:tetratricopeptide (TPR) repeat protein
VLNCDRLHPKKNALEACALATIGLRSGHTDESIRVLSDAPCGQDYHPVYQRDLLLGIAKLYRLDADADQWLERFTTHFPGKNGLKEAWQKRAWYQLLQGNTTGYYSAMWNVKQLGAARSEPDKVALREANAAEIPDILLLKGRLLFDGGFFGRAFELLKNKGADYAAHWRNNLEYHYRMGRILHKTGKFEDAIRFYETTLNSGENAPWYFACNAALQLGVIYEAKQDTRQARTWYQKCLAIHPEEYAGSLHAKAKAGLNRLH